MTAIPVSERSRLSLAYDTFRWGAGIYMLLLGMSFLFLPQTALSPVFGTTTLRGAFTTLSGLALLWLPELSPRPRASRLICALIAGGLFVFALDNVRIHAYQAAFILSLYALGILLMPHAARSTRTGPRRPDALGLVLGLAAFGHGLDTALRQVPAPGLTTHLGIAPGVVAMALMVSGGAVVAAQLSPRTPKRVLQAVHVVCGLVVLIVSWAAVAAFVAPQYWVLGGAALLRGLATAILPWWSERITTADNRTLRARLTLGFFTASLVPLITVLTVFVNSLVVLPAATLMTERQIAYSAALVAAIVSALAGWLSARRLVISIETLAYGVDRIAAGARGITLTARGPIEVTRLAAAVDAMAAHLDAQAAEEHRLNAELEASNARLQSQAEELRAARDELEQRVQERTADLAQSNATLSETAAHLQASREQLQALTHRLMTAQETERKNIARELHDETGGALTALAIQLGLLARETESMPELSARLLEQKQAALDLMQELHALIVTLRPSSLDRGGLIPALTQYVQSLCQRYDLKIELYTGEQSDWRLPPDVEVALYRLIQEALTNVVRHAQATQAWVMLERKEATVVALVEDNGIGFDPAEAMKQGRLGLVGLRERAEMLGGALQIESRQGRGATVIVSLPLPGGPTHTENEC